MSDIVGTIVTVYDFLSVKECAIKIKNFSSQEVAFLLPENRHYIIPDFQREIRWKKENLIELMSDIHLGNKFLGNVILSKHGEKDFNIIDGQQRITILLMLIRYIKIVYKEELTEDMVTCPLANGTFKEYEIFAENGYLLENLDEDLKQKIIKSDQFCQRVTYYELWQAIKSVDILFDSISARAFLDNMKRCELNVIITGEENTGYSIQYFLDVNLKGVKLDDEDIFKGYLFSLDGSTEIRDSWTKLKQLSQQFNEKCGHGSRAKKENYPLMKMIEHYFYCDLYLEEKYKKLEFASNFCLKNEIKIGTRRHYVGEHLLKVINDNTYMRNSINKLIKLLEIFMDVVTSSAPSDKFKEFYKIAKVDEDDINIFHNYCKNILLDKNLIVPKSLLMKYILSVLLSQKPTAKADYKKLYAIFLFNALFTLFENDKTTEKVEPILKAENWDDEVLRGIYIYLDPATISEKKLSALYKYTTNDKNENAQYKCKTLAAAYNYLTINNKTVCVKKGKTKELKQFLCDSNNYSVEHFIMNDSKKYIVSQKRDKDNFIYEYLPECNKYISSLFNFIFIPQSLNVKLGNNSIWEKLHLLDKEFDEIKCEYSRMIIETVKNNFKEIVLQEKSDEEIMRKEIDKYFSYDFKNIYTVYASQVISNISDCLLGKL